MQPNLFNDQRFIMFARAALIVLMVYLGVLALGAIKSIRFIGSGVPASNTISVNGEGEVFAVPDIATFSATVQEAGADVKAAQTTATKKINDIYAYLKDQGVAEKDIQTTDYSANPQYEWRQSACPNGSYCPGGNQVLTGYQVSETLTIKVRDTDKAGDLLAGVGSKGVSSVSGLTFTVDDHQKIEDEARDKAVADAKAKAQTLAHSLGVSLVRIVGFSENGASLVPYLAKTMSFQSADSAGVAPAAPEIATGQNKVTSAVSLTYEIQ